MTDTLTAEQIGELEKLLAKATPGEWEVQDSCSWRRIGVPGEQDGGVICPIKQRDGHPDLLARRYDLDLVCLLKNSAPALIAMAKQIQEWEGAFSDEIECHNHTISELQTAEAEAAHYRQMTVSFAKIARAFAPGIFSDLKERYPDITVLLETAP